MANELIHSSVGTALSQAEWEDVNAHAFNNSTQGDVPYVSSSGAIVRLAPGTAGSALITGGAAANPAWGPGTWSTWAPTLNQGGAVGATVNYASYYRLGTIMHAQFHLTATTTGSSGNNIIIGNLPAAMAPLRVGTLRHCGSALFLDAGIAYYELAVEASSSSILSFLGYNAGSLFGILPDITISSADQISGTLMYETT